MSEFYMPQNLQKETSEKIGSKSNQILARNVRSLLPLHAGMGIGASEIKQKSVETAQQTEIRRHAKIKEVANSPLPHEVEARVMKSIAANEPLVELAHTSLKLLKKSLTILPSNAPPLPMVRRLLPPKSVEKTNFNSATLRKVDVSPAEELDGFVQAVPAVAVKLKVESKIPQVYEKNPSRSSVLLAWMIDSIVGASGVVFASLLSVTLAPHAASEKMKLLLEARANPFFASHSSAVVLVLQAWLFAALFVFVFQFIVTCFFGASAGRFVVGISLASHQRGFWNRICLAMSEALCFCGLGTLVLTLPLPSRVPLFPWLRFSVASR